MTSAEAATQESWVSRARLVRHKGSMLWRLIGFQLAAFLVVWLVLAGLTYHEATKFGSGDFDRQMSMFADALSKIAAVETSREQVESSARALAELYVEYGVNYFDTVPDYRPVYQIWARNGTLLVKSDAAPGTRLTNQPEGVAEERIAENTWRVVSVANKQVGTTVQIAEPIYVRTQMAASIFGWFLVPLLWILPIIAAVTWISSRSGLRPLSLLAREINARKASSEAPITAPSGYAETRSIVDALNGLLQRQNTLIQGQRDFLADAAHELRTPLAAISAQSHVLATTDTKEEFQQGIHTLQAGVERAATLVRQLLAMARLESGVTATSPVPIDIDTFVRDSVASFAPQAVRKNIEIDMDGGDVGSVNVDPAHLQSIIDNVIDNAIRYCPPGSHVWVSTQKTDSNVEIEIADDGPGIPANVREKALARFGRIAQPGESEGSGLGLAIANAAAKQLKAELKLGEGLEGRGLSVTLVLRKA